MIQKGSEDANQENRQSQDAAIFKSYIKLTTGILILSFFLFIPVRIDNPSHPVPFNPSVIGPFPMPSLKLYDNINEADTSASDEAAELFPFPKEIETQVKFWKKIFTEYTTNQLIIHDERYLDVIYEVIDLEDEAFPTRKEGWAYAKAERERYVKILERLSENFEIPPNMTDEEERIYLLFKNISESPCFKKADAKDRVHIQTGYAEGFKTGIIRAGSYLDTMKRIFAKYNLPEELVYLPMIESTFNPLSVSYLGAAGMWQFMKGTGRIYNLTINNIVDERRDPFISTEAAARLLAHNYNVLKSWPLAITAYNYGLQGMRNAVRAVQSENIADIIEHYNGDRFGFASRNFYVEFLAAKDIFENCSEYYGDIDLNDPLILTRVKLPEYISVETFEKYCNISVSELKKLNPAIHSSSFRSGGFIPKEYHLNVLPEYKELILSGYKEIPDNLKYNYVPSEAKHRIRKSQTLSGIAKIYNISINKLAQFNGLTNPQQIRSGQLLNIPGEYISLNDDSDTPEKNIPAPRSVPKHRVRKGETLSEIAKMYNTDISRFKRLNDIKNPQDIRAGQLLKVPEG